MIFGWILGPKTDETRTLTRLQVTGRERWGGVRGGVNPSSEGVEEEGSTRLRPEASAEARGLGGLHVA